MDLGFGLGRGTDRQFGLTLPIKIELSVRLLLIESYACLSTGVVSSAYERGVSSVASQKA